jgi:hypothetical protein
MPSHFFTDLRKIVRRTLYEAALPLIGGGAWVALALYKGNSFFEALPGFGIGYLFVLSAQGQFLRIAKNVRDESDADEFRESFASIQQGIESLRSQGFLIQAHVPAAPEDIHEADALPARVAFSHFWDQAYRALDSGQFYAAVLLAAVGFESAVRSIALQLNLNPDRANLNKVIREVEEKLSDTNLGERLRTLTKIRNTFIHPQEEASSIDYELATELVNSFIAAARELTRIIGGKTSDG